MLFKNIKLLGRLNAVGYAAIALCAFCLLFCKLPVSFFNIFYIDALSAFFIFTISIVAFAAALFSIEYISKDVQSGSITDKKAGAYYILFNLFCLAMFASVMVNNLGLLWVCIELTTLASAFLVGFYNTKTSIEAAWKYIIICSVGIIFALFGTIIFYYAASSAGAGKSLNWTDIVSVAGKLDKNIVKVAFIFIIVGYGTKAGLAPMHSWLPDAHSQAISPISALLSGVLLKTAIYAILRFAIIASKSAGFAYCAKLFMIFGFISLIISAGFILIQKNLKRLLAYSSIEHIGIISLALGLGGPIGFYAAFLHIINHAVTKPLMFFCAGLIVKRYKRDNLNVIKGVISSMPFTGVMFTLGMFALAGMPPFSIFFSEFLILFNGFSSGRYMISIAFLSLLVVIFAGIVYRLSRIIFGKKPETMAVFKETLAVKSAFIFLFVFMCILGIAMPVFLNRIIVSASAILQGV